MISMVAAIGRNRELGRGNELLWRIPEDLKRFRTLTRGHPVIMGRKTFESIGKPLPERTNIVITRDPAWASEGALRAETIDEAIGMAAFSDGGEETFIIGGAQIYALALSHADKLYLTLIDAEAPDADAFFPEYPGFSKVMAEHKGSHEGLDYTWLDVVRG